MNTSELKKIFDSFDGRRILVIGDVMLDAYWWGQVERISPEAPVPIVNVRKRDNRLGGAANVALNLRRLGAQPVLCSVIGKDLEGSTLLELLKAEKISADGILQSDDRPTTVKTRVIGNKNQLLRIDSEEDDAISEKECSQFISKIKSLLSNAELVLFEDYDKGVISSRLIKEIVDEANKLGIPTVVDPKKRNFLAYENVTLFKPNLRELSEGLKLDLNGRSDTSEIESAAKQLMNKLKSNYVLITLSERGILLAEDSRTHLIPAHIRNVYDVSGAGDTVISVAALALLSSNDMKFGAALANLAGGLVCEKLGVVPIEKEELFNEAIKEFCKS